MSHMTDSMKNLGVSRNTMHVMKTQNRKKYDYIVSLDDDLEKAIRKYQEIGQQVIGQSTEDYFWLDDRRLKNQFSKYLYKLGLYGSPYSYIQSIDNILFVNSLQLTNYNTIIKQQKVHQAFVEFKKDYK